MKKLSKEEMWQMAESIAKILKNEGFTPSSLSEIGKQEMAKYDERVNGMPATFSMFSGKDYDEDDTFDYFRVLVKFHLACLQNKESTKN